MINFFDILIELFLGLCFFIASIFILLFTDYPFLIFLPFFIYGILHYSIKRRRKTIKYLKTDFEKLGYQLLAERPLKFSEISFEIKPAVLINDIPISRYGYIRKFNRIYKAEKGKDLVLLNVVITIKWSGKYHIKIKEETVLFY